MTFLRGFLRFWYELVVGDDWKIAVAVVVALALTAVGMLTGLLAGGWLVAAATGTLALLFTASMVLEARHSRT